MCKLPKSPCKGIYYSISFICGPGAGYVLDELGLKPLLTLEMRLGEGSGCPLAFQIIEAAEYLLENMGTFDDVPMQSSCLIDIRNDEV